MGSNALFPAPVASEETGVSQTYEEVAEIIARSCDVERSEIAPQKHLIRDLGLDSIDLYDVAFAIEAKFGIELPLETWGEDVGEGGLAESADLVMRRFCERVEALVTEKAG
jgi:acyl carrier protein